MVKLQLRCTLWGFPAGVHPNTPLPEPVEPFLSCRIPSLGYRVQVDKSAARAAVGC